MIIVDSIPGISPSALLDVAVRVALLIGMTYSVTVCLRRSAALRHAVWVAAISLLFVVPWLPRALPELMVAAVPQLIGNGDRDVGQARALPLGLTSAYRRVDRQAPRVSSMAGERNAAGPTGTGGWGVILLITWVVGGVGVVGRVAMQAWCIRRITRDASDSGPIAHQAERLARSTARALRLRRPVRLAWSAEMTGPLTWGVRRPFVILPSSSRGWPEARLRAVLRHELAHVQRYDYASLWLGHLATAVFWWHPAVWLAARSARRECERACDDAAIHLGLSIHDYAHQLVAIAREYAGSSLQPSAVGMADRGALRDRVKRILSPSTDRRPLTHRRVGMAWGLAVLLAIPLVVIQVTPRLVPVSELIEQLESEDIAIRILAAWRLGERETSLAVPALVSAMASPDAGVRGMAAWALGEIKDVAGLDALEDALRDPDPLVREMAVLAVGELEQSPSIIPLLVIFDREPLLRPAVLWALEQIDGRPGGNAAARARESAPSVAAWDDGERVRLDPEWLDATPRSAETVGLLLGELEDPDPTVRRDAAWALGRAGATDAVEALIAALRDPDPRVRGVAIWALDEINPSRR